MANRKTLQNITVTYTPGQVGVSFTFADAPADHFLLSMPIARQLRDKLTEAIDLASVSRPAQRPGDGVGVSDHASLSIFTPTQEH